MHEIVFKFFRKWRIKNAKIFLKNAEKIYEPPLTLRVTRKTFRTPQNLSTCWKSEFFGATVLLNRQISIRTIETNTKQQANHI